MKVYPLATLFVAALSKVSGFSDTRKRFGLERRLDDHSAKGCTEYEIDFILVEGDSILTSVEGEIVDQLAKIGITVNTRKLSKEDYNAAEQDGDFHLSFSETWGSPYDPHAYAFGWVAGDEGHSQALAGLQAPDTRDSLFAKITDVMQEETKVGLDTKWESIIKTVHDNAVMLPLWGKRIPTVMNNKRLTKFVAGNQQFDYPVQELEVLSGTNNITIAPGAQTGLFSSIGRLDPHTYRPNEFFANNWVYEGLVSYGLNGQILPALATSWPSEEYEGGERYRFNLRTGVKFHDGEDWDCSVAKLNFDHVFAKPLRTADWHGWYGLPGQIKNYYCDGEVFVIDTKDKYYPFLQELSFIRPLRMLSPAQFKNGPTTDPYTDNSCHVGWTLEDGPIPGVDGSAAVNCAGILEPIGTGPFKFKSRTQETLSEDTTVDNEVVFERNADHWDPHTIDRVTIKRYEDSGSVKAALLDGSLDLVWGSGVLTSDDLIELDNDEDNDLSVFHSDDIQNRIIVLNSGKEPLDDINVRKSVIHAINKEKIIDDNLGGLYTPVDNVFPQDAPHCDVYMNPRWDYDLEKATLLNCQVKDNSLAIGLGVGLGVGVFALIIVAMMFYKRSRKAEEELETLKLQEAAVSA